MDGSVSVAMVSEHRLFAEAVEASLAGCGGLRVVPVPEGDGAETGEAPDVVLVDSALGRAAALAWLSRLQASSPESKLVVLGIDREDDSLLELIEAGASAYLPTRASAAELFEVIAAVMRGEARCPPRLAASAVARMARLAAEKVATPPVPDEPLTPRELEVLGLMARGLRNKEIGRDLGITVQTVKNHVHSVLGKLGVGRRREAVVLAIRAGLIEDSKAWAEI